MKTIRLIILTLAILLANVSLSQDNFKWDKVDSVNKTKDQIYSDTKLYVAQNLSTPINDDKDGGIILVKGELKELITYGISPYTYYYNYNVTFLMKDNKVKILLNNVVCNRTEVCKACTYRIPCIPPFEGENYPDVSESLSNILQGNDRGGNFANLSKKKQRELMLNLKNDLQLVIDNYLKSIKTQSVTKDW